MEPLLKWTGKCDGCGEWNTLSEKVSATSRHRSKAMGKQVANARPLAQAADKPPLTRFASDMAELDRVVGGGIVQFNLFDLAAIKVWQINFAFTIIM